MTSVTLQGDDILEDPSHGGIAAAGGSMYAEGMASFSAQVLELPVFNVLKLNNADVIILHRSYPAHVSKEPMFCDELSEAHCWLAHCITRRDSC
jgi:hypothetical protein